MNYDTTKVYRGDWKVTGINADNSHWCGGDIQLQHDGHRWRCALTHANYPHKTSVCYRLTGQIKDCLRCDQRLILDLIDGTSIYVRDCPQIQDLANDLIQIKADILPAHQGRPSCEMATGGVSATSMQDFECPVCHEVLLTPKVLPCGHSLCASPCLQQLADDQDHVKCPECRADHPLPVGGTSEFPTNFFLLRVVESTKSRVGLDQSRCPGCSADLVLLRRCSHCGNRICEVCRQGHTDDMKRDLKRQFAVSSGQIESTDFCQKEATVMKRLEEKVKSMHEEVNRVTESFHQLIKKRKLELCRHIDDFKTSRVDKIQAQTQKTRASFVAFCEEKQRVLDGDVPRHIVMKLEDELFDKMVEFQSEDDDTEISDASLCLDEQLITQSLSKFGNMKDSCQGVVQAVPLDIDREFINVKCCVGRQGAEPGLFYSPTLVQVSPVTGNIVVADGGNKRIQIFSPQGKFIRLFTKPYDDHKSVEQLDINTEGNILLLCQDAILASYNENGKLICKLSVDGAVSFALAPNGDVHVGMSAGGVDVISQGRKVTSYIVGREKGRADRICITKSGEIYVLQFTDKIKLQKIFGFNREFQLISVYSGTAPRGSVRLISDKYFLATDPESHSVTIYDLQWQKIKQIGTEGNTVHRLCFPRDAAVTLDGDVVVVSYNHVMQFF